MPEVEVSIELGTSKVVMAELRRRTKPCIREPESKKYPVMSPPALMPMLTVNDEPGASKTIMLRFRSATNPRTVLPAEREPVTLPVALIARMSTSQPEGAKTEKFAVEGVAPRSGYRPKMAAEAGPPPIPGGALRISIFLPGV